MNPATCVGGFRPAPDPYALQMARHLATHTACTTNVYTRPNQAAQQVCCFGALPSQTFLIGLNATTMSLLAAPACHLDTLQPALPALRAGKSMSDAAMATLRWLQILLAMVLCFMAAGSYAATLRVSSAQERYPLWPSLTMLPDPQGAWTAEQLIERTADFGKMPSTTGTLGVRPGAVWLRTTVLWTGEESARWVLHADHAPLERMDVYILWRGAIVGRSKMGTLVPIAARQYRSRAHAIPIDLLPNQPVELLIRVETSGAMILPLSLGAHGVFLEESLAEQTIQGAMAGLALGLLFYSLMQWVSLRDSLFLYYAIFTLGALGFSLQFFGVGAQYLWGNHPWLLAHASGLSGMASVVGALLFAGQALKSEDTRGPLPRAMQLAAAITAVLAVLYAFDLYGVPVAAALVAVLGIAPALLGVTRALSLARQGKPVGVTMLVAWLVYFLGNAVLSGLIIGVVPANFWTMHAFQVGATLTMLLFMRVLGVYLSAHRIAAVDAERERDQMRSLAHTDPLTGLANRRGLQLALNSALAHASASHMVAVYMIDLDGFKAINDEFGHDTGDALLVAVARRLEGQVRKGDLVARLGGDEFVVVVRESGRIHQAHMRGVQLLEAFYSPLHVAGRQIKAGLTIGYAVAPLDGTDDLTLLRRADAALYEGKQDGKFCVRRLAVPPSSPDLSS